jgi:hypothetical protein
MAYTDQATLAADTVFRDRVRVALATAAVQVMGEDSATYSDSEYGKRQSLAFEVLRAAASGMWLEAFVWATVQNAAVTGASLDSDIQFQVNAAWGDIAGVRITD